MLASISIVSNTVITDAQFAALLNGVTAVAGDFVVSNTLLTQVMAPNVTTVGGTSGLSLLNNRNLVTVDLRSLTSVSGALTFNGCNGCQMHNLQNLNLDSLAAVGGALNMQYMAKLVDVGTVFSQLTTVGGPITVRCINFAVGWGTTAELGRLPIAFPALVSAGGVTMILNEVSSVVVSFPLLVNLTGSFSMVGSSTIITIRLASLIRVTGDIRFTSMSVLTSLCDLVWPQAGSVGHRWSSPHVPTLQRRRRGYPQHRR